jgi:urease accessory protein
LEENVMDQWKNIGGWMLRPAALGLMLVAAAGVPAEAHHVMGGRTPSSFMEGFLSAIPALFIVASAIGVALHVRGVPLPVAEMLVALSVVIAGAMIASGRSLQALSWAALFVVAGFVHGYAFGESIYGAEASPLAAYLVGLVIVQAAVATGVAVLARRSAAAAMQPRLAGAAIAGIGIAILAGQVLPT